MIDTFFNTEADRDLWLKLNAEHQIEDDKNSKYSNRLNPRNMKDALIIARNQLNADIEINHSLRYSLEDYLTKSYEELKEMQTIRHKDWCRTFLSFKS